MGISSPPNGTTEPSPQSYRHPETGDSPADVYLRVMEGSEKGLAHNSGFAERMVCANADIDDIARAVAGKTNFALEEDVSAVVEIPRDRLVRPMGPVDFSELDFDDVHDTDPGIPDGCFASTVELDSEGYPIYDIDGSRFEDDGVDGKTE